MKNLVLVLLIAFGFVAIAAQNTNLQEADKLSAEVVRLYKEKKFDEALPLAQKVVALREKEQGKGHPQVAQALRNLAFIQIERGDRKQGVESLNKALDIFEKAQALSAAQEKMYAEMLETVAVYDALEGDQKGAEKKLKRAVELNEKLNGADSLAAANSLLKLAQLYQVTADYENAAPLLLRALDIKYAKLGKADDQTQELYDATYCTLNKLDRKMEVEKLSEKFYPQQQQQLPPPRQQQQEQNTNTVGQSDKPVPRVKSGVVNSKSVNLVKPAYPAEARAVRAQGTVNVQVTIDEKGNVIYACAISGARELQRASEIAAYQSKFAPTLLSGQPVKVTGVIVYNYVP